MSRRNLGGFIRPGYNPLRVPNAPTIGTASSPTSTTASVPFTAPSCVGGSAITGYTAVSSPGCKVGTGSASPITVGCLTTGTAYTFRVFATNSYGPSAYSASSNSVTPVAAGQQAYTTPGTYSWVAPAGVTSVSVVAVGGGGGGGYYRGGSGAGLGYKNNISVTPGNSYTVVVGAGATGQTGTGVCGSCSYFCSTAVVLGGKGRGGATASTTGGTYAGTGGGNGGTVGCGWTGGGGAGGYAGSGGTAGWGYSTSPTSGAGGGGAGGGSGFVNNTSGGGGGGVGILGQGANGAPLNNGPFGASYGSAASGGGGGSGGANGSTGGSGNAKGGSGGAYGGGGGMGFYSQCCGSTSTGGNGGGGAVRIIWPGTSRSFPSTCTGDK